MDSDSARERTDSVSSGKKKRTSPRPHGQESSSDSDAQGAPTRRRTVTNAVERAADKMREIVSGMSTWARNQNKSSKMSSAQANKIAEEMESLMELTRTIECEAAFMQGRLHEKTTIEQCLLRVEKEIKQRVTQQPGGDISAKARTYGEVLKAPKVGKKPIPARDQDRVLLIYPTDKNINAEQTKKIIKESLEPRKDKLQLRNVRKTQRVAVVVETGSREDAKKIRTITEKMPMIRVESPKKIKPRLMIYDVDRSLEEADIKECIFLQNLEDRGIKEEDMEDFKICFKTGRRDLDVVNIIVEVSPKIRDVLMDIGRVYIDFASCRVVDHLSISRCYRCQGYGHVAKTCRKSV